MQVSADPYDVLMPKQNFSSDVLGVLDKMRLDDRWQDLGDGWLCIDKLDYVGGSAPRWEGAIHRTWTLEHPHRSGPQFGVKPLNLPDGQGIAEHIGFLYDVKREILWLQRDRRICGKLFFGDYLRAMTATSFGLTLRTRQDGLKRLAGLHVFRSIELAFLTDELKKARTTGVSRWLRQAGSYGAARIEIKLTPLRRGTLDPSTKQVVEDLVATYSDNPDAVAKAKVKGRVDEDSEDDFIDLVRDRDYLATRIPSDKSRTAVRMIEAVRKIWSDNRGKV